MNKNNKELEEVVVDTTTAKCYFLISNLMEEVLTRHVKIPSEEETFDNGRLIGYNDALDTIFYRLYSIQQDIDGYLGYEAGFKKKKGDPDVSSNKI